MHYFWGDTGQINILLKVADVRQGSRTAILNIVWMKECLFNFWYIFLYFYHHSVLSLPHHHSGPDDDLLSLRKLPNKSSAHLCYYSTASQANKASLPASVFQLCHCIHWIQTSWSATTPQSSVNLCTYKHTLSDQSCKITQWPSSTIVCASHFQHSQDQYMKNKISPRRTLIQRVAVRQRLSLSYQLVRPNDILCSLPKWIEASRSISITQSQFVLDNARLLDGCDESK